jgi:hypothetical protein
MSIALLVRRLHAVPDDLLVDLDKEISEAIWGDDGHTISYHLGLLEAAGSEPAKKVCDILARFLGPDHCANAVQHEGGPPTT